MSFGNLKKNLSNFEKNQLFMELLLFEFIAIYNRCVWFKWVMRCLYFLYILCWSLPLCFKCNTTLTDFFYFNIIFDWYNDLATFSCFRSNSWNFFSRYGAWLQLFIFFIFEPLFISSLTFFKLFATSFTLFFSWRSLTEKKAHKRFWL